MVKEREQLQNMEEGPSGQDRFSGERRHQIRKVFRDIRRDLGGLSQQAFGERLVEVGMPFDAGTSSLQGLIAQWEGGRYPPPKFWRCVQAMLNHEQFMRLSYAYSAGREPPETMLEVARTLDKEAEEE